MKTNATIKIAFFLLLGIFSIRLNAMPDPPELLYIASDFTFTEDLNKQIIVVADNITIDGNGYTLQGPGWAGFYLDGRSNVTIKNVIIKGFGYGIWLSGSSNNKIIQNTMMENIESGIAIQYSSNYNIVDRNNITANGYQGINLGDCSHNTISGNYIAENNDNILLIRSSNNVISENVIKDNTGMVGIGGWYSSDYNIISGNDVINNNWGIYFYFCSNNDIFHNNIIDNIYNAGGYSPTGNNWHHNELLEGNYWSDYPGVDNGSGTGKHAIAGDGIGDTNIPWPRVDFDYYPLIEPWSPKLTPEAQIDRIIDEVNNLFSTGNFNDGETKSLIVKLEGALQKLDKGNTNAACNQLGAFINQVNALINSGRLTFEEGEQLIFAAEAVIDELCR